MVAQAHDRQRSSGAGISLDPGHRKLRRRLRTAREPDWAMSLRSDRPGSVVGRWACPAQEITDSLDPRNRNPASCRVFYWVILQAMMSGNHERVDNHTQGVSEHPTRGPGHCAGFSALESILWNISVPLEHFP